MSGAPRPVTWTGEELFEDIKAAFGVLLKDRYWIGKIFLGGTLLINPVLLGLAPQAAKGGEVTGFLWAVLLVNALTFWLALGYTFEVLRRAKDGKPEGLPSWNPARWVAYAKEGAAKLTIAVPTLILPLLLWTGIGFGVLVGLLGLPVSVLGLFVAPGTLFGIPFCGVACCRYLDGTPAWRCATGFQENWKIWKKGWQDYLLASTFLLGLNSVTFSLYYSIPYGVFFGLCLVDQWFGTIYSRTQTEQTRRSR
ncbi:DUF4013 domain-containing protein [Candidatus Methylacidithermus pantelleriae]|uniref:Uncharacterized protein n=1 Tax=Candidatus Methylacidithermus pantelleriae TaxID=2744239 RepID=A0A8J2BLY2_9BACT|nr:DUF4013 domain-containing protein [Candidatus Methylacidithermus pantelleriae]CAF0704472.1 conserved membrane hypothetical protein [Candidatus Methylacidithermus pantelleriae]